MDRAEQLSVLQTAEGDPAKLAMATVDLVYAALAGSERAVLKDVLAAAAIPHWCDEEVLSALLEIPKPESAAWIALLRGLSIVEPFPARGDHSMNVHEAVRLSLREWMDEENRAKFRQLATRAVVHFTKDLTSVGLVERTYHLLCSDPEHGADELERLSHEWTGSARPEDRYALARALKELEDSHLVEGRARVWVLLVIGRSRLGSDPWSLGDMKNILDLAGSVADDCAESEAQALLGDHLQIQGKLVEAQAAFVRHVKICRRLAQMGPNNIIWQRKLAIAHSRIGSVLQEQGKLGEARAAFEKSLQISRRLAGMNPSNASLQRELDIALRKFSDVQQTRGEARQPNVAYPLMKGTMNCRSMPPEAWAHVRQALVFYFERRGFTSSEAEDLAQETLAEVFRREDYGFAKQEDFLKVCYAFGRRISLAAWRKGGRLSDDPINLERPAPTAEAQGLKDSELRHFLKEVERVGQEHLSKTDWQLIQNVAKALTDSGLNDDAGRPSTNRDRVRLHRARKLLAKLVGWRKG